VEEWEPQKRGREKERRERRHVVSLSLPVVERREGERKSAYVPWHSAVTQPTDRAGSGKGGAGVAVYIPYRRLEGGG